jgi:hypothetical protein
VSAPEDPFAVSRASFDELVGWLDGTEAASLSHAGLEDELDRRGRELLRLTAHVITNTRNVTTVAAKAAFDNKLLGNRGFGNGDVDAFDPNVEPPCDNNKWRASHFGTVNQPCVLGPGGSGTATGRSGERPGNPDRGMDAGEARGRSVGSRV